MKILKQEGRRCGKILLSSSKFCPSNLDVKWDIKCKNKIVLELDLESGLSRQHKKHILVLSKAGDKRIMTIEGGGRIAWVSGIKVDVCMH